MQSKHHPLNEYTARFVWLVLPWSPEHQGGVIGVVQQLIKFWGSEAKARPVIVVNDWASPSPAVANGTMRLRLHTLAADNWRNFFLSLFTTPMTLWRTHFTLRQQNDAAVNVHYTDHAPFGIAVLKQLGLYRGRLVISFHGTDVVALKGVLARWLRKFCCTSADAIVACSSSLADRAAETLCIERSPIKVVFNGADTGVFRPEAPMTDRLQDRLPARYIVSIGTYIARKAHSDLVEAFALIAVHDSELHLCIAGVPGPLFEQIRSRANELGLSSRVHLLVKIDRYDVACLLAHAEVCVQPALAESLPLSVLEAGAVGVPVAASAIPGHDELIVDGSTGRLFTASNPTDYSRVVIQMLGDKQTSFAMAQRLRNRITEELTWNDCVEKYQKLFRVLERSSKA